MLLLLITNILYHYSTYYKFIVERGGTYSFIKGWQNSNQFKVRSFKVDSNPLFVEYEDETISKSVSSQFHNIMERKPPITGHKHGLM